MNSKGPYSSSGSEIKFRRRLFTFSIKHEIRHFFVVVVQKRQRNVQKSVMHVQSCCFKTVSLPSRHLIFKSLMLVPLRSRIPHQDRNPDIKITDVTLLNLAARPRDKYNAAAIAISSTGSQSWP